MIRYESLSSSEVSDHIGAEIVLPERWAKAGIRSDHRPPIHVLSEEVVARVRATCSRELLHFGYEL